MSPTSIPIISRRLLQLQADPFNGIPESSTNSSAAARSPLDRTAPFDCSMALTVLVLLVALFFLAFFSFYLRRYSSPVTPPTPRPPPPNHKSGGGLEFSVVNSLPLVAYGRAARHRMIDDCPICLSEFGEWETVKLIPYCNHVFHPTCIDTWLALHVTCPLCRSAKLFEEESNPRSPESSAVRILPRGGTPE